MATTYKVIEERTEQIQCDICGGVGHTVKTFQREKYKSNCYMCRGTGRREKVHRTEVPLAEALKKLGILPGLTANTTAELPVCSKKDCGKPAYEFGLCFNHFCENEQQTER